MKRALFAWLIADGDMHLKNLDVRKIAEPGDRAFRSVRLAPVYDTLTTRVFPRLEHDRMALKLNGKDDRLTRADFLAVSAIAGLRASGHPRRDRRRPGAAAGCRCNDRFTAACR